MRENNETVYSYMWPRGLFAVQFICRGACLKGNIADFGQRRSDVWGLLLHNTSEPVYWPRTQNPSDLEIKSGFWQVVGIFKTNASKWFIVHQSHWITIVRLPHSNRFHPLSSQEHIYPAHINLWWYQLKLWLWSVWPVGLCGSASVPEPQPDKSIAGSGHHWSVEEDGIITQQEAATNVGNTHEGSSSTSMSSSYLKSAVSKTFSIL